MLIEYCMYCNTQLTEGFPEFEDCTTLLCDNCGACIDIWHPTKDGTITEKGQSGYNDRL